MTQLLDYDLMDEFFMDEEFIDEAHRKGKRKSTKGKHQKGEKRLKLDQGGEKGDARRGYYRKRPKNWKGSWPPKRNRFDVFDGLDNTYENYFDELEELIDQDESLDKLISPNRANRTARFPSSGIPPYIRHGEITTARRASNGYAQLITHHFVGYYQGSPNRPLGPRQGPGCAGLALVHTRPTTINSVSISRSMLPFVEYRVFDNTLRNILWWGRLGTIDPTITPRRSVSGRGGRTRPENDGEWYERAVRAMLSTLWGQRFQRKIRTHGPDLIASSYKPGRRCKGTLIISSN